MRCSLVLALLVPSLVASGCAHTREVGAGMMALGGGTAVVGGVVAIGGCDDQTQEPVEGCQDVNVLEDDSGEAGLMLSVSGLTLSVVGLITYLVGGGGDK